MRWTTPEVISLIIVLFLSIVLIFAPLFMLARSVLRRVRAQRQLGRMKQAWQAERTAIFQSTMLSRPLTAIASATMLGITTSHMPLR